MGVLIDFPASGPQTEQRKASYFDRANWSLSRKGNRYLRHGEFCITIFPQWNGWLWSIAYSARERPVFSEIVYESEDEARRGAWAALAGLMERRA